MSSTTSSEIFLGEGTYGKVLGKQFAVKVQKSMDTLQELAVLLRIKSEHKLSYIVGVNPDCGNIVMKVMTPVDWDNASDAEYMIIYRDIISAIQILHQKYRIVHCDIQPDNILRDKSLYKLVDYGTSFSVKQDNSSQNLAVDFCRETIAHKIYIVYEKIVLVDFGTILYIVLTHFTQDRYSFFCVNNNVPDVFYKEIEPYVSKNGNIDIETMYSDKIESWKCDIQQINVVQMVNNCEQLKQFVAQLIFLVSSNDDYDKLLRIDKYIFCIVCDWFVLLWNFYKDMIENVDLNVLVVTCIYLTFECTGNGWKFEHYFEYSNVSNIPKHEKTKQMYIGVMQMLQNRYPVSCSYKQCYDKPPINFDELVKFYCYK